MKKSNLEIWEENKTLENASAVISELSAACQFMLLITGGSKHWNGETEQALRNMEEILGSFDPNLYEKSEIKELSKNVER